MLCALSSRADKYVPFGMHHNDAGYDVNDPALTDRQREILEFPPVRSIAHFCIQASFFTDSSSEFHTLHIWQVFFNEREIDGEVMKIGNSKDSGKWNAAPLRHADVQTVQTWHFNWRQAANL